MSENALFELAAIVSFQFALSANLLCQEPEDERVFSHPFELNQAFLWQGYGFRRGGVMSKVIKYVAFPNVSLLRTDYASKTARTNYASTFYPSSKCVL